ncbi:hypothetical protein [Kiloniella sp.]|uniref:hypothetical protein n=1 Tax=Kiloniella sp. TaxID=1938587 RepID=UPI003B021271
MSNKIIIFNGPPRSGKDTGGETISKSFPRAKRLKFSDPLKKATHAAFDLRHVDGRELDVDHFERVKDVPLTEFFGSTPRQAYINYSELHMKVLYGKDVWGHIFMNTVERHQDTIFTVPEGGFIEEVETILKRGIPAKDVLFIRVRRQGCSFEGDSRSYLNPESLGIEVLDLDNTELFSYQNDVISTATSWLNS